MTGLTLIEQREKEKRVLRLRIGYPVQTLKKRSKAGVQLFEYSGSSSVLYQDRRDFYTNWMRK